MGGQEVMERWREYNEGLVKRGEILLGFGEIQRWEKELARMNAGKRGRKYEYSEDYIKFLCYIRMLFYLDYRAIEGFARSLSKWIPNLKAPRVYHCSKEIPGA
jgi:hypothetical protein